MAHPSLAAALIDLDAPTRALVQPALTWFAEHGAVPPDAPSAALVGGYLGEVLPTAGADGREAHEVAWSLGDLFEAAGLSELGALCRAAPVHARLAAWRWTTAFSAVPSAFWQPAMAGLDIGVPSRVRHSLASTTALLVEVGDGVEVTVDGHLLPATVRSLDDRFRWTEEFPWMRSDAETDVSPLHFLHEHLRAQGLLARADGRLVRTPSGVAATDDLSLLWRAMVAPEPRWRHAFELDALGVLAASLHPRPLVHPGAGRRGAGPRARRQVASHLGGRGRSTGPRSWCRRGTSSGCRWAGGTPAADRPTDASTTSVTRRRPRCSGR